MNQLSQENLHKIETGPKLKKREYKVTAKAVELNQRKDKDPVMSMGPPNLPSS